MLFLYHLVIFRTCGATITRTIVRNRRQTTDFKLIAEQNIYKKNNSTNKKQRL